MVSGKPYISVKSATRNATKAPKERQSRAVRGRVKLKAKMIKTAKLMTTSDQRPYAGASLLIARLLQAVDDDSLRDRHVHRHAYRGGNATADTAAPAGMGQRRGHRRCARCA